LSKHLQKSSIYVEGHEQNSPKLNLWKDTKRKDNIFKKKYKRARHTCQNTIQRERYIQEDMKKMKLSGGYGQ